MKRKNRLLLLALFPLVALSSCATYYQKEGVFTNGYSDFRTASNSFVVTFRANEMTPPEKVMEYALRRASEVTLKHGFQYFAILDEIDTSKEKERPHLSYPSVRLVIECFQERPADRQVIEARAFL